jgi:hypothetical protein
VGLRLSDLSDGSTTSLGTTVAPSWLGQPRAGSCAIGAIEWASQELILILIYRYAEVCYPAGHRRSCRPGGCPRRDPIPPRPEAVAALKERLHHAPDGHQTPRLQMRYLLASGPVHTRHGGARLLGVHRNPVSHGLAVDATGGLAALLAPYVPPGTPVSRAPEGLARLEQALRRREGFASYEARRQWVRRTHGVIAVLSSGRDEHSLCFSSEVAPALVLRHCRQQLLGVRV